MRQEITTQQISMKKLRLLFILASIFIVNTSFAQYYFSVSSSQKVNISPGNLQYQASTSLWRFAENQFDIIGDDNAKASSTYDGWIDLFGWGTSGWNSGAVSYMPYNQETINSDYLVGGKAENSLTGAYANADWGIYNPISNGGNKAGMWRTMTEDEWKYLRSGRENAEKLFGVACVNEINGAIFLPDNWELPAGMHFQQGNATGNSEEYYKTVNSYTLIEWRKMEKNGAIFLPCAGTQHGGGTIKYVNLDGSYWSSTAVNQYAFYLGIRSHGTSFIDQYSRGYGRAVRLVKDTTLKKRDFDFKANTTYGCSPLKVVFENLTDTSIVQGYSFEWTVEPGKYSTQYDSVQNTYINPGTYDVTMKVYDSNKKLVETVTKQHYITVHNDPDVTITSDKEFTCENKPFNFSIDSIKSDTDIVSYTWILSDGSSYLTQTPPAHTFGFAGDFDVFLSVTDENGCSNRERKKITVTTYDDYPAVSFAANKTKSCEPQLDVTFTNTTTDTTIASYVWDFGDGTTFDGENPPVHTYTGYGSYYAYLTATTKSECESRYARSIQLIDYQPEIGIDDGNPPVEFDPSRYSTIIASNPNTDCPCKTKFADKEKYCPGTITFSDASTSRNTSWKWDLNNDGSIESTDDSFSVDLNEGGTYTIKLTVSNGTCTKDLYKTIVIENPLEIVATPTDEFQCSIPAKVTYSAVSNIAGTNFMWITDGNKIDTGDSFSRLYESEGIYSATVYALSPNYCKLVTKLNNNLEITTPKLAKVYSTYAVPRSGCVPLDVTYYAKYSYNTDKDSITTVSWDYDEDGTYDDKDIFSEKKKSGNLSHIWTYNNEGVFSYHIALKTSKGCAISNLPLEYKDSISVGHTPDVNIDFIHEMCASDSLTINVTFDDKDRYQSEYDTLLISFTEMNGLTNIYTTIDSKTPIPETFAMKFDDTVGVHYATFTASDNGCSITKDITEGVDVKGPMTYIQSETASCDEPFLYKFFFIKNYGADSWEWFIQKNGEKTWTQIAENEDTVNVNFEDYGGRGQYWVKVTSHNPETGCDMSDSIVTTVTKIVGDFELATFEPCLGDTAQFVVRTDMGQDIHSWTWINKWNGKNDSLTFAVVDQIEGTIDRNDYFPYSKKFIFDSVNIDSVVVKVTDIHGCNDYISKPIKIYEATAGFYGDVISDCLPFTTTFTDTSKSDHAIAKRIWNLGNGVVSEENEMTIQTEYNSMGNKTISLIVIDDHGCRDTASTKDYIKPVVPNAQFSVKHNKLCLGHEAELTRNTGMTNFADTLSHYSWNFGDGTIVEETGNLSATTKHTYETESKKNFNIKLIAYSISPEGHECVDSSTQSIDVKDVGAKIKIKDSDLCKEPGQKFILYLDNTIYTSNTNSYSWWKIDGGDSLYISNKKSLQVVTFDNFGDQSLWLRTTSNYYGCEDTTTFIPVHVPGYEASLIADKEEACVHEDVTFTLLDTLNLYCYDAYWEFGDGQSVYLTEGNSTTHQYTALAGTDDNTYKAQFIVDAPGCKARDISVNVKLFPVIAMFIRGEDDLDTAACAPFTVTLQNTSVAGENATYLWNIDGKTSTEKNPTVTINDPNTIIPVSLSVTSNICNDTIHKNISTYPLADVSIALDSSICVGETITATATGNFTDISWMPDKIVSNAKRATTNITPKTSQYVYVYTKNSYNCLRTDSIFLFVQQKPYYFGAPDSVLLFYGADGELKRAAKTTNNLIVGQMYNVNTNEIAGVSYSWSPATYLSCTECSNPDIDLSCTDEECLEYPESIDYQIFMQDTLGCFTNDTTIHFNIIFDTKIAMPEAFTPNGDGINDIAFVRGWGIREFIEVKIYNRWGQIVYESDDMAQGWDGTYKGEPQGMDTYSYTIKATNMKDEEVFAKGYITLIR